MPPSRPHNDGSVRGVDARDLVSPVETPSGTPGEVMIAAGVARSRPREIAGRKGADPTRFGDWEKDGRCIDF